MEERTQKQEKTDEEQARDRAEFVEFQYGLWDLVLRSGPVLSSLVVFGGVFYLAGGLHASAYFSAFGASWLVWELPGNSFPFRILSHVFILIFCVTLGARVIVYEGSKKKCSWVVNLISRHEPHRESLVGYSLFMLVYILYFIIGQAPLSPSPWMVAHPYLSSGLSFLGIIVFMIWTRVAVLGPPTSKRNIVFDSLAVLGVMLLGMFALAFLRPYCEGCSTKFLMGVWGIIFGIGFGVRALADLTHSNEGSLLKYSIPSPHGGWSAANAFPLYLAFVMGLFSFSLTDGLEQSLYDQGAGRSRLPIVVLKEGNPSCRNALLITSSRVYTVTLQSLPLNRRPDVVPVSWENISQIQAPEFGKCLDSLLSNDGSVPIPF